MIGVALFADRSPTTSSATGSTRTYATVAPTEEFPPPAPVNLTGQRVLFVGDSFTEGTAATPLTQGYAYLAGAALGGNFVVNAGSGSGYVNPGVDDVGTFGDRIAKLPTANPPTLIIVQGSINDQKYLAELPAASEETIAALRGKFPKAQIVMFGPIAGDPANPYSADTIASVNTVLAATARALSVQYIDATLDPWVTTDNAEVMIADDKVHPRTDGHKMIATRLVAALRATATQ